MQNFSGEGTPPPQILGAYGASIFPPTALKLNVTPPKKILVTALERTFAPVELLFRGTLTPGERKVQELSFHGTFAPVERSLHKQLSCPLTFAPVAYLRLLRRLVRAAVL